MAIQATRCYNAFEGRCIVRNNRFPNNVLSHENLASAPYQGIYSGFVTANSGFSVAGGRYVLAGGAKGVFAVANPSRNSTPMLRTKFKVTGMMAFEPCVDGDLLPDFPQRLIREGKANASSM